MADINALFGKTVLWIGNECQYWSLPNFAGAARTARSLGYNSICPKRADGTNNWFGSSAHLAEEAAVVRGEGVGFIPFGYCYGPKFGAAQIRNECLLLQQMGDAVTDSEGNSYVQADMEIEWDGVTWAAQYFTQLMRPWNGAKGIGLLSVSTWADPNIQNWDAVAWALAPCVNAWTPQRYNDWLAHQPLPAEETIIQPGVDLTQEFGTNHPVAIATGHPCVFAWEYIPALQNPNLSRQLTGRVG